MSSNQDIKKPQRKQDERLPERMCQRGKQNHQKMKPFIVFKFLLKYTDENHTATAYDIIEYLADHGISADRRSIYKDIREINIINLMLSDETDDLDYESAAEIIDEGYDDDKLIQYDSKRKGYYVFHSDYTANEISVLAECIYAFQFINSDDEDRLIKIISDLVSEYQVDKLRHNGYSVVREKTKNKYVLSNIEVINDAMSEELNGEKRIPTKITFSYLTHEINDVEKLVERKKKYKVSPYHLILNDGYYYLLAYSDDAATIRTYRVDRMKSVSLTSEAREGEDAFRKIDVRNYSKRVFSMYSGEHIYVRLRFNNRLIDTVIDRFGSKGLQYIKDGDSHFIVTVEVDLSDQFFGWIAGLETKVKIMTPQIANQYKEYLKRIISDYDM